MSEESSSNGSRWKQLRETLVGLLRVRGAKEWGSFITGIYLGLIALYVISRWGKFCNLPPNELGDFLAGAFGPVAFLWLILGYLQQGDELRQNGEALRMQAEELAKSVEQHKELVKASQEQVAVNREALLHEKGSTVPLFEFIRTRFSDPVNYQGSQWSRYDIVFICRNANAHNISIDGLDSFWEVIPNNEVACKMDGNYTLCILRVGIHPVEIEFLINFSSSDGYFRSQRVSLQSIKGTSLYSPKVSG